MLHSCMEEVIALALWDRDTHVLSHTHTHTHTSTSHASNRRAIRKSRLPKREFALCRVLGWSFCLGFPSEYHFCYKTFHGNTLLDMYHGNTPN